MQIIMRKSQGHELLSWPKITPQEYECVHFPAVTLWAYCCSITAASAAASHRRSAGCSKWWQHLSSCPSWLWRLLGNSLQLFCLGGLWLSADAASCLLSWALRLFSTACNCSSAAFRCIWWAKLLQAPSPPERSGAI